MESKIEQILVGEPISVDDLLAQLSVTTGLDDKTLLEKMPKLKGYGGEVGKAKSCRPCSFGYWYR